MAINSTGQTVATTNAYEDVYINGVLVSGQVSGGSCVHAFDQNDVMTLNTGVMSGVAGAHNPTLEISGFSSADPASWNIHTLLSKFATDNTADSPFRYLYTMGSGAVVTAGRPAFFGELTRNAYNAVNITPKEPIPFDAQFGGRGKYTSMGRLLYTGSSAAASVTSILDCGAIGSVTAYGAQAMLQCYLPSGLYSSGWVQIGSSNPANNDTIVFSSQTATFKTALSGSNANEVKIGATTMETMRNLYAWLVRANGGRGVTYQINTSTYTGYHTDSWWITPPDANKRITITRKETGDGWDGIALEAGTGTAFTFNGGGVGTAGGANVETATITIASATSEGGSYTTHGTFTHTGADVGAELLTIARDVTINRYIKLTITRSTYTRNLGIAVAFARNAS